MFRFCISVYSVTPAGSYTWEGSRHRRKNILRKVIFPQQIHRTFTPPKKISVSQFLRIVSPLFLPYRRRKRRSRRSWTSLRLSFLQPGVQLFYPPLPLRRLTRGSTSLSLGLASSRVLGSFRCLTCHFHTDDEREMQVLTFTNGRKRKRSF